MRVYKKFCYSDENYNRCVEITSACANENNCDFLIEESNEMMHGYLLFCNSDMSKTADKRCECCDHYDAHKYFFEQSNGSGAFDKFFKSAASCCKYFK